MSQSANYDLSFISIDFDALQHNVNLLINQLSGASIIAVVKADAYGHGAISIAKAIEPNVAMFAVAQPIEAIDLRNAGITKPIMVLCAPDRSWHDVYATWNLIAVASAIEHLQELPAGTQVHLEFDTGMHRLGFHTSQLAEVLDLVKSRHDLIIDGLMTHFANADLPGHPSIEQQELLFKQLSEAFPKHWMRHISNSAAVISSIGTTYDAVRVGLMMFGYEPGQMINPGLKPVKQWISAISQIRIINKDEPVSYGWTWKAPADGWLGVIPVGYADGYPRSLSSKSVVALADGPAQLAGRVTMDYIMIWTDRRPLILGEKVILLGGEGCDAKDLAAASDTIAYDILCQTGRRRGV
jgi:alanine racemase